MIKNGLKFVFAGAIGATTVVTPWLFVESYAAFAGPLGMPLALASGIFLGCEVVKKSYKDSAPTLSSTQKNLIYTGYIIGALAGLYHVNKDIQIKNLETNVTAPIETTASIKASSFLSPS